MSDTRPISPALQEKAKRELNEDPARRGKDVTHIRDWLKNQPHIEANNPSDQVLIAFLRASKFDLKQTKDTLDLYYTLRTTHPELFSERNIRNQNLKEIMQLGIHLILPGVDNEGRKVYIIRPGYSDPNKHSMEDQIKIHFMLLDWLLREDDDFIISGCVGVMDMSNMTLRHGMQISHALKKYMGCSQDAYPIQTKEADFLHTPAIFGMIFQLFKSFAKDAIKDKFFSHGSDFESFHKNVPRRMLPKEYGGDAGTVQDISETYLKHLEEYTDFFLEDEKCGVDESKRHQNVEKNKKTKVSKAIK